MKKEILFKAAIHFLVSLEDVTNLLIFPIYSEHLIYRMALLKLFSRLLVLRKLHKIANLAKFSLL